MALKITDIGKDLPKLNNELSRLDQLQQTLTDVQSQLQQIQKKLLNSDGTVAPINNISQNNITFTWTGGTLTISWAAGYTHSSGHYLPIPAGTLTAAANTYYWMAWNPKQQTMSALTSLAQYQNLPNRPNLLVLAQIFTGTAGQTGSAGGGGTEPGGGIGINSKQYKNF